eukprot:15004635-Ditylum_brightwellii.AAC.1
MSIDSRTRRVASGVMKHDELSFLLLKKTTFCILILSALFVLVSVTMMNALLENTCSTLKVQCLINKCYDELMRRGKDRNLEDRETCRVEALHKMKKTLTWNYVKKESRNNNKVPDKGKKHYTWKGDQSAYSGKLNLDSVTEMALSPHTILYKQTAQGR